MSDNNQHIIIIIIIKYQHQLFTGWLQYHCNHESFGFMPHFWCSCWIGLYISMFYNFVADSFEFSLAIYIFDSMHTKFI